MFANPRLQGVLTHLFLALAGAAITLSLAPFRFWWTAPLACAVLAWGLRRCSPRAGFLRGWSFGAGMFLAGTSWVYVSIHVYGYAPAPLAAFLTAAFCIAMGLFLAVPGYVYCRWVRNGLAGTTLGFAGMWVVSEWLRSWVLTGFPWLYLGYGHLDTWLAGWAPVGGVLSISFIMALLGAGLWHWLENRRHWLPLAGAAVLALMGASLQQLQWTHPAGEALRVAAVQPNIPQEEKWLPRRYRPTLQLYEEMTLPLLANNDIVVWPEAAIPASFQRARSFLQAMSEEAERSDTLLITGIPYREGEEIFNSAVALGSGEGVYFKQRLVPFGEYVPMQQWLGGLLRLFELPMSNFSGGPRGQTPLRDEAVSLSPFICYEIAYPGMVARGARRADILLTLSNDAWFGRSFGPDQHMQIARMRALETGRQMIRATGTGISALVDERGRITASVPQFERTVLNGEVQPRRGSTPFSQAGSVPIVSLSLLLLALCAWTRRAAARRS